MQSNQGFSLLGLLISVSLFAVIATGFVHMTGNIGTRQAQTKNRLLATMYTHEAVEITYNIARQSWREFSQLEGEFHPVLDNNGIYVLAEGEQLLGSDERFRRSLEITHITEEDHDFLETREIKSTVEILDDPHERPVTHSIIITDLRDFLPQ